MSPQVPLHHEWFFSKTGLFWAVTNLHSPYKRFPSFLIQLNNTYLSLINPPFCWFHCLWIFCFSKTNIAMRNSKLHFKTLQNERQSKNYTAPQLSLSVLDSVWQYCIKNCAYSCITKPRNNFHCKINTHHASNINPGVFLLTLYYILYIKLPKY